MLLRSYEVPKINMKSNFHPLSIGKNVLKRTLDDLTLQVRPKSLQTVMLPCMTSLLLGIVLNMPEESNSIEGKQDPAAGHKQILWEKVALEDIAIPLL